MFIPFDPGESDLSLRLIPPGRAENGRFFLLGTDYLGRDIFMRIIYGGRISIAIGISATVLSLILGTSLGLISGTYGKFVDTVIMRLADIQLSFPFILLAIVAAAILKPSVTSIIIILAFSGWVRFCRLVRSEVLVLREREFVQAAKVVGVPGPLLLIRHILPNVTSSLIVQATLEMSRMIVMEATLGFLGLGIPPPTPTWGGMLSDGRAYLTVAWWVAVFPGLTIFLLVLCINLFGDWLRDFFDPRLQK